MNNLLFKFIALIVLPIAAIIAAIITSDTMATSKNIVVKYKVNRAFVENRQLELSEQKKHDCLNKILKKVIYMTQSTLPRLATVNCGKMTDDETQFVSSALKNDGFSVSAINYDNYDSEFTVIWGPSRIAEFVIR